MKQEIRLVITQKCNFNCYFCHHEGICEYKEKKLNEDDIAYLFNIAKKEFGINTMTITGGEPLLVNNICDILKKLNDLGCKTTIVTNGSLLRKNIEIVK